MTFPPEETLELYKHIPFYEQDPSLNALEDVINGYKNDSYTCFRVGRSSYDRRHSPFYACVKQKEENKAHVVLYFLENPQHPQSADKTQSGTCILDTIVSGLYVSRITTLANATPVGETAFNPRAIEIDQCYDGCILLLMLNQTARATTYCIVYESVYRFELVKGDTIEHFYTFFMLETVESPRKTIIVNNRTKAQVSLLNYIICTNNIYNLEELFYYSYETLGDKFITHFPLAYISDGMLRSNIVPVKIMKKRKWIPKITFLEGLYKINTQYYFWAKDVVDIVKKLKEKKLKEKEVTQK